MTAAAAKPKHSAVSAFEGHHGRVSVGQLLKILVKEGQVAREDAERMHNNARLMRADMHALVFLAEQKLKSLLPPHRTLDLESLTEWFARHVGLPYAHIDPLRVEFAKIADVMSSSYAARFKILPLVVERDCVTIATSEPFLADWEPELRQILRKDIKRVIANPLDIDRFIVEFFNLAKSVKGASLSGTAPLQNNFEQLVELGKTGRQVDANDAHIVTIVDWLWQYAFDQRASDIHLEPRREHGIIRFRIDGVLHQVYQVPSAVMSAMISRIKLLGRMDIVEKRRPLDGRIKTRTPGGQEVEMRLSTLPTAFGEKLVMRIFDPEVLVRDLAELGFSDDDAQRWHAMTSKPNGIILVTGPTGSGKTTTLYSTLKQLATQEVNVCTVEDPIEMVEPSFNQMQVQQGIDLSFADGLRALMRQDPDIIMVGEIRDLETAEMAIQASLTGHLVLSTLHTNDAPSAITRLLDLGVPPYLLNATLLGVMAQRLVRTLCPHCKAPATVPTEQLWNDLLAPWKLPPPKEVYQAVGCLECRMTGYHGRAGIYEIMLMSEPTRALVNSSPDIEALRALGMREGMKPLRVSGAIKVSAGVTTLEEVIKVAPTTVTVGG
ncbi:MAG: type II/IV secretion system protein [Burkholderiaceae bacterium]|nr:MAG: type II/IV secretion system protein [Burkholderiaceae bacterium]